MHKTIVKALKILLSFIVMTLSPFVLVVMGGGIYVIVQLINGLSLTASISSFKVILVGLVPYFPYLTTIPVILILFVFIIKKGLKFHSKIKNLDDKIGIVDLITRQFPMIGEYKALAYLGRVVSKTGTENFAGKESRIDFGKDPQQHVLIIEPSKNAPHKDKAIFFTYGGGWKMGNPEQYVIVGRFFAKMGYPTILAGYRLAPHNKFPIQNEDVSQSFKTGIKFLREKGINVNDVVLGGHSAGAQLVSLLAMDKKWLGLDNSLVCGLFTLSGPLDFSLCKSGNINNLINGYIGKKKDRVPANPILFANYENKIPVLCLHGGKDPVVNLDNSKSFVEKLNIVGEKRATLYISEKRYHSDMLNLFFESLPETKILTDWLEDCGRR